MPAAWRILGPLRADALEGAICKIIERHEPLRTNYLFKEGRLFQIVAPPPALGLSLDDLTGHAQPDQELARIVEEEVAKTFDLERDLMIRCRLVRLAKKVHVLIAVFHHIATDRWSSRIFARELGSLYRSISQGRPSELEPLPTCYRD
jgi:uncharacterized membrane protein YcjF (UPF0283 family)